MSRKRKRRKSSITKKMKREAALQAMQGKGLDALSVDLARFAELRHGPDGGARGEKGKIFSKRILELHELRIRCASSGSAQAEPAYREIARRFPGFSWSYDERGNVRFQGYPRVGGHEPTLAELLVIDPSKVDCWTPKIQRRMQPLIDSGPAGLDLAKVMVRLSVSRPPDAVMGAVIAWLQRALQGESSTIFSTVCPDYAVDAHGRYTFEGLNSGVGVVAKRLQVALPVLWHFCNDHGLPVTFVVAMGDSEADNPDNCRRVGLTRTEFIARLEQSQAAFRASMNPELPLKTPMASQIGSWLQVVAQAREAAASGRFSGVLHIPADAWDKICAARRSLFTRWYGAGVDASAILRAQAPEYMAMGTLATEHFPNTLILGADTPAMAAFWQGLSFRVRPVLYLQDVQY